MIDYDFELFYDKWNKKDKFVHSGKQASKFKVKRFEYPNPFAQTFSYQGFESNLILHIILSVFSLPNPYVLNIGVLACHLSTHIPSLLLGG